VSYGHSREIRIYTYYIPIVVKSTAQIFGLFGDQKYSDSVSRIWLIHEERRNVTNSKLDWAVVFTTRYARRKGKTVDLGLRLLKPSKAVADLLGNHESLKFEMYSKSLSAQHTNFVNITFLTISERIYKKSLAGKPLLITNQPW